MRLLVTGGLGFIGSNFILKLLSENDDLKILNVDAELDGSNPNSMWIHFDNGQKILVEKEGIV